MSENDPKNVPSSRLQAYLSGIVWRHKEADTLVVRTTRQMIKWFFDLVRNVLIIGVLKYLATKSGSLLLKVIWDVAFASLGVYCLSYMQTWQFRFFHPWWPANWARVADLLINLAVIAPIFYIIVYTVPWAIDEIARGQAK
jgi:hypothetical protein